MAEQKDDKLTAKQEKFLAGIMAGLSQREAYKQAYNCKKMSDSSIDTEANAMLNGTGKYARNPKVARRYKELSEKVIQEAEAGTIATAIEVRQYLTKVMRRELKESVVVTCKKKETKWVLNEETGKQQRVTIEEDVPEVVEIPSRLSDANKAAELLGKTHGLFNKVDLNVAGEMKVDPVQIYLPDNQRNPDLKKKKK